MIDRYSLPGMRAVWESEKKYKTWLKIEILACEAMAELGIVTRDLPEKVKKTGDIDVNRINEIESVVKHDVIAFLTSISEQIGEESRYIHLGLTSSDILDTSLAILMKEAAEILIKDIISLMSVIKAKAIAHKETVMIGRSHGIHGEPITFGFKMALWYEEMKRNLHRMERAKDEISYGKLSGAMGTFAHIPPFVEEFVCRRSGLKPDPVSSQIIQRDRHAFYLTVLAIIASSIDKFATEIRHLQRTEVLEAEEYFSKGQKGSSAMPHKRNPVLSENLSGLARIVRANSHASLENIALWHERDISHSSVERVVIPDSTILLDFMLNRITGIIDRLIIYPDNMEQNLNITNGIIYSQKILLILISKGLTREDAYKMVQKNAMKAWNKDLSFKNTIKQDQDIKRYLSMEEIDECFDYKTYLRNIDDIYRRVFD
ncbi:MAG: adenylosuccinate lyase [Nitrospirota bacterium]